MLTFKIHSEGSGHAQFWLKETSCNAYNGVNYSAILIIRFFLNISFFVQVNCRKHIKLHKRDQVEELIKSAKGRIYTYTYMIIVFPFVCSSTVSIPVFFIFGCISFPFSLLFALCLCSFFFSLLLFLLKPWFCFWKKNIF